MAQVDAFRFLSHVALLFAPNIQDGQTFTAYIGQDNSFSVQADNIIKASGGGSSLSSAQADELEARFSALQSQATALESLCSQIPAINAAVSDLISGEDTDPANEYDFSNIHNDILTLRADFNLLEAQFAEHIAEANS